MNNCLIVNDKIRNLTKQIPGETDETVKGLVALWQKQNNKSTEDYPEVNELISFKETTRNDKKESTISDSFEISNINSLEAQKSVDLNFDPKTRRDRVSLIARLFSNEIDKAFSEIENSISKRLKNTTDKSTIEQLLQEKSSIDRMSIIKQYKPSGLFRRVFNNFNSYLLDTTDNQIQAELNYINSQEGSEEYTEEEKRVAAERKAEYKRKEYQKIVDHFTPLAEEASELLLLSEGIRVSPSYEAPSKGNLNDSDPEGNSLLDDISDNYNKEEEYKDGWMVHFREVSSHDSLSQAVRKTIRQIPKLDYEGYIEEDDLGFERYLDANYVHAVLIDKLRDMIDSTDLIPMLKDLESNKLWVSQITELLESDETLFSQFYQDFRKDFSSYWVQKKANNDGVVKYKTIAINKPEGIYYLLDSWRDNYESGTKLDKDSVYEKNGDLNIENAEKGLSWVNTLNNKFNNLDTESRLDLLGESQIWNSLLKLLHMIGIDANPSILKNALFNIQDSENIKYTDPIMLLLPQLNIIYSGIIKGDVSSTTQENGKEKKGDLINTFGSAYNSIASMMAAVTEDAIESSITQNIDGKNKSFYGHTVPNYLGKLVKNLKNVRNNTERFQKFIDSEFKQFDWFYKNGRWLSDWIEQLATSAEARKGFDHKILLGINNVSYKNWDDIDYTVALLTEYWGDPSKGSKQWAWYHIPILSDSPSAEFIRFRKYVNNTEIDEETGDYRTYDNILLDKYIDLVNQEYNRIMLVRERGDKILQGDPNVSSIANFDISYDKKGNIKNLGGAEFKFLPALNNLKYNGELFIDRLGRMSQESTGEEFNTFIRSAISQVLEEGFETTYTQWSRTGLFEENNGKYKHLPFIGQSSVNNKISKALVNAKKLLGTAWTKDMELLLNSINNNYPTNTANIKAMLDIISTNVQEVGKSNGRSIAEINSITNSLFYKNNAKEALREYYWNSTFATSQIIQLTTTDLAFYKNIEDFQKRYKEIHSPALRMNTKATFKGELIGRDWERTIYLQDDVVKSKALEDIITVLDERVKKGDMSKIDRDNIVNKFKEVNVADAQAYRSLSSYRAILGMSGQWTDAMEKSYNNFKDGNWDISDFNIIWQTKKPFVYTQVNNISGVDGFSGIKTPIQHKNSEFLLLAMHELVAGPLGKSGKLRAINDFMESKNIDVVQFESSIKVGKQGVVNINDVHNYQDVTNVLLSSTMANGIENPNVIHKVSYEDYGIQTATPEHSIDAVQLIGTQIRKLITADISDDVIITVDNKSMTKKEWLSLYNAINTENILQSFQEVSDIFKDPKKVEELLLSEIKGNARYGNDMIHACTLNENGEFNIPLFDPIQSQTIQTLLNSVLKSRITKQKIKGGALIQVSDYGLTDDLKIVFEGEGENKKIKYLECYMPAYSKKFYEPLMKEGKHELNIEDLPKDLRKLIGYRIPTEDKYSMAPLYIKGFLPQQNGSAIMLPLEITTLSGSDFDVDKLYIMLPEFKVSKYDMGKARKDFTQSNKLVDSLFSGFTNSQLAQDISEEDPETFKEWFMENKKSYTLASPRIQKIKYNHNKLPQENSREARNNLIIDLMWGVLTNADTASKILNPGGFDYQKSAARIVTILQSSSERELRQILDLPTGSIVEKLKSMSLDSLDNLAEKTKNHLNPLSPRTQVILHQQNMNGGKLIGIYANHNANHALIQHTNLELDVDNGSFVLNGKRLVSLHNIKNDNNEFISKNNAGFLAASVDNVKDPVLNSLNQNTFTADASMLLSRLGYNPIEIGLLMSQPIILDITTKFFRDSRDGKSKDVIIEEILRDYKRKAALMEQLTYDNYKNNDFSIEVLANNILISKEVSNITSASETTDYNKVEYYKKQVAVGYLFKRILKSSEKLGMLVQITRADSPNGGPNGTIADTIMKIKKAEDFRNESQLEGFPLINSDILLDIPYSENINEVRDNLLNSPLTWYQGFHTLGLNFSVELLKPYFPYFNQPFIDVIDSIRNLTKFGKLDSKTMNSIFNDLLSYIMSKESFFGAEISNNKDADGNAIIISSEQKREDFINNFPEYFKTVVTNNMDIADLEFIKRLKVIKDNQSNPVSTLVFKNVGKLSTTLRDRYTRDWTSLLYLPNPEATKLAVNLLRYSYYRNGFAFGPSTFTHLAPILIRDIIPDYINTLRGLLSTTDDYSQFVDQYVYNHLDNRKLVPELPEDSSISIVDSEQEILNEITITIGEDSKHSDKKIVKKREETPDGIFYEFFKFITKKVKDKNIYYRIVTDSTTDTNTVVYQRINPLGFKNSFLEYEYGKDAEAMNTVINKNRKDYNPLDGVDVESFMSYNTPSISEDDISYTESYKQAFEEDVLNESMQRIYGESFNNTTSDNNDITSLSPFTDYKDENGNKIC